MGQKSHPRGLRLGIIEGWDSKWYASHNYATLLHEDLKLRDFIKRRLYHAGISRIEIERMANKAKINIHTARPGIVIGKKGAEIDKLKGDIQRLMKGKEAFINIHEVRRPDLDPQLVAENIALQLERRVAFRRAMKEAVLRAMRMGAQGVKVHVAGRLGGAEIARVAALYKDQPGGVRVIGYAAGPAIGGAIGGEPLALYQEALDRAQAVATALTAAGIPAGKIQTEAAPAAGARAAGRVDIQFTQ